MTLPRRTGKGIWGRGKGCEFFREYAGYRFRWKKADVHGRKDCDMLVQDERTQAARLNHWMHCALAAL